MASASATIMSKCRLLTLAVLMSVLLAVLALPSVLYAGANAGGIARLSWERDTLRSETPGLTPGARDIFVLLSGVVDVASLAISFQFAPSDSAGSCLRLGSGQLTSDCGVAAIGAPGGGFDGDSTYTWTISFPSGIPRTCVAYSVISLGCEEAVPASFRLTSVRVADSNGVVDDLALGAEATVLGGLGSVSPFTVLGPTNRFVNPSLSDVIGLRGSGFSTGTSVKLQSAGAVVIPLSSSLVTGNLLQIRLPANYAHGVLFDIVVHDSAADTTVTLQAAVLSRDTTALTGDGVNGYDVPIDRFSASGVDRKQPGEFIWNAVVPDSSLASIEAHLASRPTVARTRAQQDVASSLSRFSVAAGCSIGTSLAIQRFEDDSWTGSWNSTIQPGATAEFKWGRRSNSTCGSSPGSAGQSAMFCSGANVDGGAVVACNVPAGVFTALTGVGNPTYVDPFAYRAYDLSFKTRYAISSSTDANVLIWRCSFNNNNYQQLDALRGDSGGWVTKHRIVSHLFENDSNHVNQEFIFHQTSAAADQTFGAYVDDVQVVGLGFMDLVPVEFPDSPAIVADWKQNTSLQAPVLYTGMPTYFDISFKNESQSAVPCDFTLAIFIDELLYATVPGPKLRANEVATRLDIPVTLPEGLEGRWDVRFEVDYGDIVREGASEDNNSIIIPMTWSRRPDLAPVTIAKDLSLADAGQNVRIQVGVSNLVSNASANITGSIPVHLQRRQVAPVTSAWATDTVGTIFGGLNAGATKVLTLYRTRFAAGTWEYRALVDSVNSYPELSENNNQGASIAASWQLRFVEVVGRAKAEILEDGPPALTSGNVSSTSAQLASSTTLVNVANARVWIIDVDHAPGSMPDTLGSTFTAADGTFGPISIADVDVDEGGYIDLQVVVTMESRPFCGSRPSLVLVNGVTRRPWEVIRSAEKIDVRPQTADGDVGELTVNPNSQASASDAVYIFLIGASTIEWVTQQGVCLDTLHVLWTADVGTRTAYDATNDAIYLHPCPTIFLAGAYSAPNALNLFPDTWDGDVIRHEIGHHIAKCLNFSAPEVPVDGHFYDSPIMDTSNRPATSVAFEEGWATFFACITPGHAGGVFLNRQYFSRPTNLSGYNHIESLLLEEGAYYKDFTLVGRFGTRGEGWEVATAAELWDLYDGAVDQDTVICNADDWSNGWANIWATLRNGLPYARNLCDFNNAHDVKVGAALDSSVARRVHAVYCAHGAWPCFPPITTTDGDSTAGKDPAGSISFANPSRGALRLSLQGISSVGAEVELFDLAGRSLGVRGGWSARSSAGGVWSAQSRMSPGVYMVRIRTQTESYVRRVVYVP